MSNFSENTQLTSAIGFDASTMVFGKPQENVITLADKKKIKYYRIPIGVKNPDGTVGDLIFPTERVFSFGVQENKNDVGKIDGYSVALCMWDKNGATKAQTDWLTGFNSAIQRTKEHVLSVRDEVEKYDLENSDLKRFNPLYWKREKGKIVEGRGPTLYPKLLVSRKDKDRAPKILTSFEDEVTGEDIDPLSLLNKYSHMQAAIKLESIFCGSKVSPQVKLYEAIARLAQSKSRKLLRPTMDKKVRLLSAAEDVSNALGNDYGEKSGGSKNVEDDEEEGGSLEESDASDQGEEEDEEDEEEEVAPPPKTKKVVKRKVVRRKVRKST